ncbi:MAG TPA: DNA helicase UvrBC, partial [Phycisphaerales bacterium]|nr:DNA helicase UvrBC [Phycisphaerales bacterium]
DTKEQMQLLKLRQRLESAVQSEDYELAAKLRDEIKKAEK